MFGERREFQKIGIVLLQLIGVFTAILIVRSIPYSELKDTSIVFLLLLHVVSFYISNYYYQFFQRGYLVSLLASMKYSIVYAVLITFISFMTKNEFSISRTGLVYFVSINMLGVYVVNILIRQYYSKVHPKLKSSKKVLLITVDNQLDSLLQHLVSNGIFNYNIAAISIFDKDSYQHPHHKIVPKDNLISYVTHAVIDEVLISLPSNIYSIQEIVLQFENMGIDVHLNVDTFDLLVGEKKIQEFAGLSVLTFTTKFHDYSHIVAKRILDIIGSLIGLVICGVIALFLVPIIRKDGGSAIFSQKRVGKNGRIFKFYKFRSMYVDAEEQKKKLLKYNTMTDGMFKMDNDPRITPIGRFIRKTSLDELPQFYNVLRGDMSLVGTRPPTLDEYENYTPEQKRRLSFKPGITGLWQVSGRSQITEFEEVVKLDLAYIDGWTIWLDIKILLKTIKVVLIKDGAK